MAALPVLKVNGVPLKNPTETKFSTYNLVANSGRTANGNMTMDITARKAKLECRYEVLSGKDMDMLRSLIDHGQPFFIVEHLNNGRYERYTMYSGAIHADHFRRSGGWYWRNVAFDLIEQ